MLKFAGRFWKKEAWEPLEEVYEDALAKKKRMMVLLIRTQESELQRAVTTWHTNIKLFDEVQRCKLLFSFYTTLNLVARANVGSIVEDENSRKQERALDRIFQNY